GPRRLRRAADGYQRALYRHAAAVRALHDVAEHQTWNLPLRERQLTAPKAAAQGRRHQPHRGFLADPILHTRILLVELLELPRGKRQQEDGMSLRHLDLRLEDDDVQLAMALQQRSVSDEQLKTFEGYAAEIFSAFGLDLDTA